MNINYEWENINDLNMFITQNSLRYNPCFEDIFETKIDALLLSVIIEISIKNNFKPFYKFATPCNHKYYVNNQSWCECLRIGKSAYFKSIKNIGYKILKGEKIKKHCKPVEYWTNNDRVTYFRLNKMNLHTIYINNYGQNYLSHIK